MSQNDSLENSPLTTWIRYDKNPSENRSVCKYPAGLYIVSTPIGNLEDITIRALNTLAFADVIACEDTRQTQKLLNHFGLKKKLISYFDHNDDSARPKILSLLAEGLYVALVSDAGTPLISDPGYKLVDAAIKQGHYVTAVPGPSSLLAGLVIAGLPSDHFFFEGFLPPKSTARKKRLDIISTIPGTLIFFETAPRLSDALSDMLLILGDRPAALTRELTKKFEECVRGNLSTLKKACDEESFTLKGEFVLIVAPQLEESSEDMEKKMEILLREQMAKKSLKDAVDAVHEKTHYSKKDIYKKALSLKEIPL